MFSIPSAIAAISNLLGAALKALMTFAIFRQGEVKQASKDEAATLSAIDREREADAALPKDNAEAIEQLKEGKA